MICEGWQPIMFIAPRENGKKSSGAKSQDLTPAFALALALEATPSRVAFLLACSEELVLSDWIPEVKRDVEPSW